ncbi:hypothetical protein V5O48_015261 [Marasmius crinis-equi]|uniref:Cytochrome P450 n=1 Tax=Marasmius crinis-equi TaxID=585013 RepID=A0ABR3EV16_9AGAR
MSQASEVQRIALVGGILGVINHLFLKRHEPARKTVPKTILWLLLQPLLVWFLSNRDENVKSPSILLAYASFFTSLTASVIFYRLSPFHPLAKVPGPTIFKITKLWRVCLCMKGYQYLELKALHDQYGPIVRTGPNEVSVIDAESVKIVQGTLPKGHAYLSGAKPPGKPGALIQLSGEEHKSRRRVWSRGFSSESLKEYEPILRRRAAQLADRLLEQTKSTHIDLLMWLNFLSFDIMSEMAFGGGELEMLKNGADTRGIFGVLRRGLIANEIISHMPWFSYIAGFLPVVSKQRNEMLVFAVEWCTRRMQNGAEMKDLWYHLTDEPGYEKVKPATDVVASDALLAIIAGYDTTAMSMANIFYCLLSRPECYKRVQEEVDREYPPGTDPLVDVSRHGNLRYLHACINETLRLLPPVPSSGPRVVPKGSGGKVIHGHFLPEGTQIYVPPYSVHRNPENFSPSPDEFLPERWLEDDELVVSGPHVFRQDAYIPFASGPSNCIGKNLARMEIVMVIIMLIQRFLFEFAEGFDWKEWPAKKRDAFATISEPLEVTLKARLA